MKEYIGDGIYAEYFEDTNMVRVSTSDGINDTNVIFFEPEQAGSLIDFFKRTNMRN